MRSADSRTQRRNTPYLEHRSGNDVAGGVNNQLAAQVLGVLATWIYAGVMTLVLVKVIDATIGLRVTEQDEEEGLDLSQHGEVGLSV